MKWVTDISNIYLIKKWRDWKLTSQPLIYFDVRVIYICTTRFKNLIYDSVWKSLAKGVFTYWLFSLFNHKVLYVGCETIPGFTSARNLLD